MKSEKKQNLTAFVFHLRNDMLMIDRIDFWMPSIMITFWALSQQLLTSETYSILDRIFLFYQTRKARRSFGISSWYWAEINPAFEGLSLKPHLILCIYPEVSCGILHNSSSFPASFRQTDVLLWAGENAISYSQRRLRGEPFTPSGFLFVLFGDIERLGAIRDSRGWCSQVLTALKK